MLISDRALISERNWYEIDDDIIIHTPPKQWNRSLIAVWKVNIYASYLDYETFQDRMNKIRYIVSMDIE